MTLIFEQTKNRNDRPAWFVYREHTGERLGRVELDEYRFRAANNALLTAGELLEIADFVQEAR